MDHGKDTELQVLLAAALEGTLTHPQAERLAEPATVSLLGLGAFALIRRKRK